MLPFSVRGERRVANGNPFAGNKTHSFFRHYRRKKNCCFGRKGLELKCARAAPLAKRRGSAGIREQKLAFLLAGPLRVFWRHWRPCIQRFCRAVAALIGIADRGGRRAEISRGRSWLLAFHLENTA